MVMMMMMMVSLCVVVGEEERRGCRGVLKQEQQIACNKKKLHATTRSCNAITTGDVIALQRVLVAMHLIPAG